MSRKWQRRLAEYRRTNPRLSYSWYSVLAEKKLPRWGVLLLLPVFAAVAAWCLQEVASPSAAGGVAGAVFGLIGASVFCLGEIKVLLPQFRIEVLYHSSPSWLPGEGFVDAAYLLGRSGGQTLPEPGGAWDHYPDDYAGRVISVRRIEPGYLTLRHMADKDRRVVELSVTQEEFAALSSR